MTNRFRRAASASVALLACSIAVFTLANRSIAHASNPDARVRGAIAFHAKGCERCHSITGIGGDRAPDLSAVGQRRAPHQIETQILKGGHNMPPFEHVLTKGEVKDLVVFLYSCRTETPPGCREAMQQQQPQ
jgi:mono/diheme cytochrome c family protein